MKKREGDIAEAVEPGTKLVRRRAVIAAASGLVAAALAKSAAQPGEARAAADTGDFLLGTTNKAAQTTELDRTGGGHSPALAVFNSQGVGVVGQSPLIAQSGAAGLSGVGVLGATGDIALADGVDYFLTLAAGVVGVVQVPTQLAAQGSFTAASGVRGHAQSATGVIGSSVTQTGVVGLAGLLPDVTVTDTAGVIGIADGLAGVAGIYTHRKLPGRMKSGQIVITRAAAGVPSQTIPVKTEGNGLLGVAVENGGAGVLGIAVRKAGSGVDAVNLDGGIALMVDGRAAFSTAGGGVITQSSTAGTEFAVLNAAVTRTSHVTVTLLSNPGSVTVSWVELQPGVGFTIHLSAAPQKELQFSYLIVESSPEPV